MGLDMYLAVESTMAKEDLVTFLEKEDLARYWSWSGQDESVQALGNYEDGTEEEDVYPVIAYWRKANAIHAWFVRTQADGVDECQKIPVHLPALKELRDTCVRIIEAGATQEAAEEHGLPTQGGFFFGSTSYNEWYKSDLEDTVKQLDAILAVHWPEGVGIFYEASW